MAIRNDAEMRDWAIKGAEQRLVEIAAEAAAIHRTFPELRARGARGSTEPQASNVSASLESSPNRRARPKMSPAQRKEVGKRMKKYWAARRAQSAGAVSAADSNGGRAKSTRKAGRRAAKAQTRRGPRKMSAAARKRISEAQKARWAKKRGAARS